MEPDYAAESSSSAASDLDEYKRWKRCEPRAEKGSEAANNPIIYWVGLRDRYPQLSRLALDVISIPASGCDCERMFSELGDLLEPRRQAISPQLLAAIQSLRLWQKAGFGPAFDAGIEMPQPTANALGNFDIQGFRVATVMWLVNQNHPLSELMAPDFRETIRFANPEAEAALWVVNALSSAASRIHLAGAHTGEAIAKAISMTLSAYGVTSNQVGYFVLDNAANNDTAIAALAREYNFDPAYRRLRCSCHTLNLIGQAIIFGNNKDAYGNTREQYSTEEQYMREWRKDGPIGVLVDVINYIKTPQQYELFRSFQHRANADLPAEERLKVLEPVKPVVTRWNSYYAAFERATKLSAAYNLYAEHHINRIILEDAHANKQNNKRPDAPSWMRSTGLRAADWAVIAEYQDCLTPLNQLKDQARLFEQVDFNAHLEAPEDHLKVNLLAAWAKANDYYSKLDASPAYYAAVCLHPYYKTYCDVAWADKAGWLSSANVAFQQLWAAYKPHRPRQSYTAALSSNNIDEAISAILGRNVGQEAPLDEFERWKMQEPQWTQDQYTADGNPVQYWIRLLPKYPHLAQFAIDIMTIPASSSDCERLSSELGDLLEPNRRALGSELLAALQFMRSWLFECDFTGHALQSSAASGVVEIVIALKLGFITLTVMHATCISPCLSTPSHKGVYTLMHSQLPVCTRGSVVIAHEASISPVYTCSEKA
ncbi:HAT domain-containing protein [Stemphylium lycopersici]|nr:HAT domain-containing protein [Stemphylium lycopersici]